MESTPCARASAPRGPSGARRSQRMGWAATKLTFPGSTSVARAVARSWPSSRVQTTAPAPRWGLMATSVSRSLSGGRARKTAAAWRTASGALLVKRSATPSFCPCRARSKSGSQATTWA